MKTIKQICIATCIVYTLVSISTHLIEKYENMEYEKVTVANSNSDRVIHFIYSGNMPNGEPELYMDVGCLSREAIKNATTIFDLPEKTLCYVEGDEDKMWSVKTDRGYAFGLNSPYYEEIIGNFK